jgi:hypothetical protein
MMGIMLSSPSIAWGGGPPKGWWRGNSPLPEGYPSTMLRMVPLPILRMGRKI